MEKKKILSYVGQLLIVFAGCASALWVQQQMNKPKVMPPAVTGGATDPNKTPA